MFNKIVFDANVWTVYDVLEYMEQTKCWGGYYGHPSDDQLGFGRYDAYRIPPKKKQMVFAHRYTDAVIHYSYREG